MPYKTKRINPATVLIQGEGQESMYLVKGSEKALLIDTGMEPENLGTLAAALTDKPVLVALTHGHYDHIGRTGDFDEVYMDLRDNELYREHSRIAAGMDGLNCKSADQIQPMPAAFALGDITVQVVPLKGHTPGSVLFVDTRNKMVFTGDAVGSGCGCLMSIPGAQNMSSYKEGLDEAIARLETLGVTDQWTFRGGHDGQEYRSLVSPRNPLDLQLIKDMSVLCGKLLDGTGYIIDSPKPKGRFSIPYYAVYGKAEMDLDKTSIY